MAAPKWSRLLLALLALANIAALVVFLRVSSGGAGYEQSALLRRLDWAGGGAERVRRGGGSDDGAQDFEDVWESLAATVPSVPPVDFMRAKVELDRRNFLKRCQRFPRPSDLFIANEHWQMLKTDKVEVYLHSAHLDFREEGATAVRMVAMIDKRQPDIDDLECLLWYGDVGVPTRADVVEAQRTGGIGFGFANPFLVSCRVDSSLRGDGAPPPEAVSLAAKMRTVDPKCKRIVTNCLRLVHKEREVDAPPKLAVCLKGISFSNPMMVTRLVEWIELQLILGVDKIFFHHTAVAPEILDMLLYYQERGKIEAREYVWAGPYSRIGHFHQDYRKNLGKMTRQDNIPYNSCFYTAMEQNYDYVAILDIDEVIMPLKHTNLLDLLSDLEKQFPDKTLFSFRNTYFMDSMMDREAYSKNPNYDQTVPEHMHMLRHLVRSQRHSRVQVPKSIYRTRGAAKTVIAHFHSSCLQGRRCPQQFVSHWRAQMAHYREGCTPQLKKVCNSYKSRTAEDLSILRFKDELVERAGKTLEELDFFSRVEGGPGTT